MNLYAPILGESAVRAIRARAATPILVIGRDRFTRHDLAIVECFNYTAAYLLTVKLGAFDVASTADVYRRLAPRDLAIPGLGAVSLAVLGAAFEAKGVGTLDGWVTKHRSPDAPKIVTFDTIKAHSLDQQAATRERRAAKARTRSRRDTAHRLRVDRHMRRVSTTAHETETAPDRS